MQIDEQFFLISFNGIYNDVITKYISMQLYKTN